MADLKTQLEIGVDGSSVASGVNQIKQSISSLGGTVESAGSRAAAGIEKMGTAGDQAGKKLDAATRNLIANAQRNLAAIEAGVESNARLSGRFIESLGRQRGADMNALRPYIRQLDEAIAKQKIALGQNSQLLSQRGPALSGVTTSLGATAFSRPLPANLTTSLGATAFGSVAEGAKKAAEEAAKFNKAFDYTALTAKQTTAALRQVPAQLTDIIVSLQGGQAPLTVLLQQGGQLKDVFGGIGPAARALGGYLLSLVNPLTLTAAAIGAIAFAYKKGSDEADAFANALILSGNAAGTTTNKLTVMAQSIDSVVGTQAEAAEAIAQFAGNGKIAANNIEDFSRAAIKLERTTGQAISKTVEQFASLRDEPVKASIKLNETTNFLTLSIYKQIKALEEQGRTVEAASLAQRTYASEVESRSDQIVARLGFIERAWKGITSATKEAGDALLNVGRPETLQAQLDRTEKLIEAAQKGQSFRITASGALGFGSSPLDVEAEKARADILRENIRLENRAAEAQGRARREVQARIEFDEIAKKNLVDKGKLLEREIELIRNAGKAAGASQKEIDAAIEGAKERFKPPKGPRDPQRGLDRSDLQFDLSQIKSEQDRMVAIYADAQRILETLRAGGLVNERDYYESRRQFIALESAAKEAAFREEIRRLQEETGVIAARKTRDEADRAQQERDQIDNARKIAKARADLALLEANTSSRQTVLNLEQANSVNKLTKSYEQATMAAQFYLDTQNKQQDRALAAFGQGDRQAARNAGIAQIEDRFISQRQDLEMQRALLGSNFEEEYQQRLKIINEFQQKSVASFVSYYDKLIELQANAAAGANRAVENYIDSAANVAESTNQFVTSTLSGLEDSLTRFLTTGKGGFKEFANAIVADITRIIVKQQIANALASQMGSFDSKSGIGGFLSSLLGSGSSSSRISNLFTGIGAAPYAMGGSVTRGQIVEVNERGAPGELFNVGQRQYLLASQAGTVVPQKRSTNDYRERGITVVNNFHVSGSSDARTQNQIAVAAGRGLQLAIQRNA